MSVFGGFRAGRSAADAELSEGRQQIPVKFSLGSDRGLAIFAIGYPKAFSITCPGSTVDPMEEFSHGQREQAGSSTARQRTSTAYWRTSKKDAGKCSCDLQFVDGETYSATQLK